MVCLPARAINILFSYNNTSWERSVDDMAYIFVAISIDMYWS